MNCLAAYSASFSLLKASRELLLVNEYEEALFAYEQTRPPYALAALYDRPTHRLFSSSERARVFLADEVVPPVPAALALDKLGLPSLIEGGGDDA